MVVIARVPLSDEIENRLRDQILTGKLQPGQRLTEQGVAREMGTSQGPVREAFSALVREGLLISLPHRGTFVSAVSEQEARTAYQVRGLLEPYAMEQALSHITPRDLRDLGAIIVRMREAAQREDFPAAMAADLEFHGRLYELGGGAVLAKIWSIVSVMILKFALVAAPQYYHDLDTTIADHERILRLLETGEVETLRDETLTHLNDIWTRISSASDDLFDESPNGARGPRPRVKQRRAGMSHIVRTHVR